MLGRREIRRQTAPSGSDGPNQYISARALATRHALDKDKDCRNKRSRQKSAENELDSKIWTCVGGRFGILEHVRIQMAELKQARVSDRFRTKGGGHRTTFGGRKECYAGLKMMKARLFLNPCEALRGTDRAP